MKSFISLRKLCLAAAIVFISFSGQTQCNTNISICSPGVAGPFSFAQASPNPSSCLDYSNGQTASAYAYIILYITQAGSLNLLIDGNLANGCLDVAIFDITGQADPCASLSTATEIGCNYASMCDGCNEFGANFPCGSETPAPMVSVGDVLMILVEDWDGTMTNFTLELSNAPGSAQTGVPPANITPIPNPICLSDPAVQLVASSGGGTWSGTGVTPGGVFDPNAAGIGTFTIDYTIGTAPCDASDQTTITVVDCSVPCAMTSVTAVPGPCDPADNFFDVTGTVEFTNPPATGQLIIEDCNGNQATYNAPFVSPLAYSIDNINSDGTANCSVTASFTDDPLCTISSSNYDFPSSCICPVDAGVDQAICEGDQITLSGSLSANYIWDNGVIDGVAFTPPVGSTTYTVSATDAAGCQATDQVVITVQATPLVDAGPDLTICVGSTATLNGSGATSYLWDNGVTDGVAFTPALGTQTYSVVGEINGCTATDEVDITVIEVANVSFIADVLIGCEPLAVNFTNTSAVALTNCSWDYGDGSIGSGCASSSHTYSSDGLYDVTFSGLDPNGCLASDTYIEYITVEGIPDVGFFPSNFEVSSLNPTVDFFNTTIGGTTYTWDFGDESGSTEENPSHTYDPNASGSYIVQLVAVSDFGCIDSISLVVSTKEELIFYVPNAFTPDGDEFNQTFNPIFSSGHDPYDYTLLIYNRFGEVIFESNNVDEGWDGTYNGRLVQAGTYTWTIEVKTLASDERVKANGHVSILK